MREDKASDKVRRQRMEFHENRARQPFIGFILLWRFLKKWWVLQKTRRILQRMSDEQLKDVGLRRDEVG